ncbi:hypothetical protein CRENBAI_002540 [Crenichthys baileyi]|uniref:Uncharacterized protein n=1 Tax=Crenichthys baileyi TaxID=28760 RepID=A0AAV9S8G5_9TELE
MAPALSWRSMISQGLLLADLESLRGSSLLSERVLECQRLLMEGMKYHLLPQRRPLLQSPRTRPRKATVGAMFAVGGMDASKGATSIEQYCLRRDTWRQDRLRLVSRTVRTVKFGDRGMSRRPPSTLVRGSSIGLNVASTQWSAV